MISNAVRRSRDMILVRVALISARIGKKRARITHEMFGAFCITSFLIVIEGERASVDAATFAECSASN